VVDQGADLELGVAGQLALGLANERAGEGEQVGVGALAQAAGEFLGLGFEIGGQRVVVRHGVLPAAGGFSPEADFRTP
jgi:hypothetical protein